MGLFKHSTVEGINAAAEQHGLIRWPNDKVASAVCLEVSSRLGGDERLQHGLSKQAAMGIFGMLKTANEAMVKQGMQLPDPVYAVKSAAARDLRELAFQKAADCMRKAAEESGSLTDVGPNTPESAAASNDVAALDLKNRAVSEYLVGVGNSGMPQGGVLGKEQPAASQPGIGTAGTNSVVEQSKVSQLAALGIDRAKIANMLINGSKKERKFAAKLAGLKGKELPAKAMSDKAKEALGLTGPKKGKEKKASAEDEALAAFIRNAVGAPVMTKQANEEQIHQLLMALEQAGIDPSQLDADDIMQALQMMNEGGGGAPPGAGAVPPGTGGGMPPGMMGAGGPPQAEPPAPEGAAGGMPPGLAAAGGGESEKKKDEGEGEKKKEDEEDKQASWLAQLRKMAEGGSLTNVGPNTPESAARTNDVAKLDVENRKPTEYLSGLGKSEMPDVGQMYAVQAANKAPTTGPSTTPSRETKTSQFTPEQIEYLQSVEKMAKLYGPKLPSSMPREEKIAHLKNLLAVAPQARDTYVQKLSSAR